MSVLANATSSRFGSSKAASSHELAIPVACTTMNPSDSASSS